ncbi:DUF6141 family protein [Pontibacter sp. MBLB2868]|uniref:DUF6141 family protein n=1 Tax=Pontibacter sp. MBLB2868 TaxID=3451555 RepID=UPI003F754335
MTEQKIILYREQQRFKQFWLWIIILGAASLFWAGFFYQVIERGKFGDNLVSDAQLVILFALMGLGLPYFFYAMKLTTEVLPGEVRVQLWPFHLRPVSIPMHLVRDFRPISYSPIQDYGGWGIRWGHKGKAYNMSGNEGVLLLFYNRRPLLIGSQSPHKLFEAVRLAKDLKPEQ